MTAVVTAAAAVIAGAVIMALVMSAQVMTVAPSRSSPAFRFVPSPARPQTVHVDAAFRIAATASSLQTQ